MPRRRDYPDHVQLLLLLWRGQQQPPGRTGLDLGRVVDAGIALADARGLAAVTMRGVAESLGVGAMTLYTYVPGKDELVALMVDRVEGELPPGPLPGEGWRDRAEALARQRREVVLAHPWLAEVPLTRPVVGPNAADRYEAELAALDGIGLTDLEMDTVLQLVHAHVISTAAKAVQIARDAERSGVSDDEWWYSVLPTLTEVMADRDYPVAARVGATVGAPHTDPAQDFELGLQLLLDGIGALLGRRS